MHETPALQNKPKVCFVSPYIYPLFNSRVGSMFGGWEVRIALLAKEIAKRGNFRVSIIVADHGQPAIECREGIELISWRERVFKGVNRENIDDIKDSNNPEVTDNQAASVDNTLLKTSDHKEVFRQNETEENLSQSHPINPEIPLIFKRAVNRSGKIVKRAYKWLIPWKVRIFATGVIKGLSEGLAEFKNQVQIPLNITKTSVGNILDDPIFPEMINIYGKADADLYVVPGNNYISAEATWYCKKYKRIYVMMAGSDIDFDPKIKLNPENTDAYGMKYSRKLYTIHNASIYIVQNEQQAKSAKLFGCDPFLIPNPVDLDLKYPKSSDAKIILWVGNTEEQVKQPSLMLEAIRRLPEYQFVMIVTNVTDQADLDRLASKSQSIANLSFLSRIPYEEVEKYFAEAKLFVNTSTFEGFPNTFLQAGKYGIPVVSLTVDPNGMFTKHGCGLICDKNFEKLIASIQSAMEASDLYTRMSNNILEYVKKNHDKDKVVAQFEDVLLSALRNKRKGL